MKRIFSIFLISILFSFSLFSLTVFAEDYPMGMAQAQVDQLQANVNYGKYGNEFITFNTANNSYHYYCFNKYSGSQMFYNSSYPMINYVVCLSSPDGLTWSTDYVYSGSGMPNNAWLSSYKDNPEASTIKIIYSNVNLYWGSDSANPFFMPVPILTPEPVRTPAEVVIGSLDFSAVFSTISGTLSVVLVTGLLILAILLGVSLIPRVISSFKS